MLPVKVAWVDAKQLPDRPYFVLRRPLAHGDDPRGGVYQHAEIACVGRYAVPQESLLGDDPQWSFTETGEFVRVPLIGYRTTARALASLFGLGLDLGLRAMASFAAQSSSPARRCVLVLANDVASVVADGEPAFLARVGVAVVY